MNVRYILNSSAEKYGEKAALIFQNQPISFSEVNVNALKLANALKGCSIRKGDKVAVYLPNCPEYAYAYLASFCLGTVCVPLDFMLKTDELISCLQHSETKILIASAKEEIDWELIRKEVPALETIIVTSGELKGTVQYQEIVSKSSPLMTEIEINDLDPALIMYTSGTTGKPKGILLNFKHLEGSPRAMQYFVDLTDNDVKLCAIPLSHIAGLIYIQNCIISGITLILMPRFNPYEFLKNIQQYKVTCFHIVPAMYMAILTLKQIEKFDLSSLRWVVVFGAPSSPDILERFHKYCPNARLLNGWGMTETCPPNTVTPLDSDNIQSVGKPAPHCEIKIVDDQYNELPRGEVGEVIISGWVIMDSYYKDPELTAQLKRGDWLHTGDLGKFDAEGYLYIVGRKKEMIKVGGQIVFAPEVESALYKNENVSEAAVIGTPDKMRGEVVKACVVLKEGVDMSSDELKYFVKEHLANFKVPQVIEICDSLPKNRVGKIDKEALKKSSDLSHQTSAADS